MFPSFFPSFLKNPLPVQTQAGEKENLIALMAICAKELGSCKLGSSSNTCEKDIFLPDKKGCLYVEPSWGKDDQPCLSTSVSKQWFFGASTPLAKVVK